MVRYRHRKKSLSWSLKGSRLTTNLAILYASHIFTCFAKLKRIIHHKDALAISPLEVQTILSHFQAIFLNVSDSNAKFSNSLQKRVLQQLATNTTQKRNCQYLYQEAEYILESYLYDLTFLSSRPEVIAEYKSHQLRAISIAKQDVDLAKTVYGDLENKKCLFVGCGVLPMTIIEMVIQNPMLKVDLLDMSEEALVKAQKVTQRFNLENNLTCLAPIKIEDFEEIAAYEVVWFAAMVGASKEDKIEIYTEVHKNLRPHQSIITRTVSEDSFSELLYAPFPVHELGDKYQLLDNASERSCIVDSIALQKI